MRGETEAFEGAHVELTLDKRHSKVAGPDPVFYAGAGGNAFELSGKLSARGQQTSLGPAFTISSTACWRAVGPENSAVRNSPVETSRRQWR